MKIFSANFRRFFSTVNEYTIRSHTCGELRASDVGKEVRLCGWVQFQRLGKFLVLRDSYGSTQVYNGSKSVRKDVEKLSAESVVRVDGEVAMRPPKDVNPKMATGEIELHLKHLTILNRVVEPLRFEIDDYATPRDVDRFRLRYLDIRRQRTQRILRFRARVISRMRHFLESKEFIEVETPTLFRRTPGGAAEFVVPSSVDAGRFYSLPQSPQQFKQLLMVGGVDRYFQIARCYRDETVRTDRQPEFTQLDIELSFTTQRQVMKLIEDVVLASWPTDDEDQRRFSSRPEFQTMTYNDALRLYGSDKPDLRFDMKIQAVDDYLALTLPNAANVVDCALISQWRTTIHVDNKKMDATFVAARKNNQSDRWEAVDEFSAPKLEETCNKLAPKNEDVLLLVRSNEDLMTARNTLGILRTWVADAFESRGIPIRSETYKFLWVVDFPLFLPGESNGNLESAHHPFTAPVSDDQFKLESAPTSVVGQHYDLVLNGVELGGGSIRIHDAALQTFILENILHEDPSSLKHLIDALASGAPPHGGFAIGLDRYVAVLLGLKSIREVVAFPKTSEGRDIMAKAPAEVGDDVLRRYHIKVVE